MPAAIELSPSDLTVLDVAITRMVRRSFGALGTLPLFCLGKFDSPSLPKLVEEHHDAWHSFLVVARETLRGKVAPEAREFAIVHQLITLADVLRDAYLELGRFRELPPDQLKSAFNRLADAYQEMPRLAREISDTFDLKIAETLEPNRILLVATGRNLKWFSEELQTVTGVTWPPRSLELIESE